MSLIVENSLFKTLDNLNDLLFWNKEIPESERIKVAEFLASLQNTGRGSYNGTFKIPKFDYDNEPTTFTGEKLGHGAQMMHVLSEETFRALNLLDIHTKEIDKAYQNANDNFLANESIKKDSGTYCCGTCSVGFWRNLITGGFDNQEERIYNGLLELKHSRDSKGRWRRFPFYYTSLILTELGDFDIKDELEYIAPSVKRMYKRLGNENTFDSRKKEVMSRLLGMM